MKYDKTRADILSHMEDVRAIIGLFQESMDATKDYEEWQTLGRHQAAMIERLDHYQELLDTTKKEEER